MFVYLKEGKKNTKLIKTVYKEHGTEIAQLKSDIHTVKEDAYNKAELVDVDVQFLAKDFSKIKEAVDEL
jgi:hypothetical protein